MHISICCISAFVNVHRKKDQLDARCIYAILEVSAFCSWLYGKHKKRVELRGISSPRDPHRRCPKEPRTQ